YEVTCVFPAGNGTYLRKVAQHTKRIHVFPYDWWKLDRLSHAPSVSRFERIFRRERVDLVHVNTITLLDPLTAARRLGVPSIVHARELIREDADLAAFFGADPDAIVRTVRGAADFIIGNSDETRRTFGREGRSFRLYNGVDV